MTLPSYVGKVLTKTPWLPVAIAGVDPGTLVTGVAIVSEDESGMRPLHFDAIRLGRTVSRWKRIHMLYQQLLDVFKTHRPVAVAIEAPYVKRDVKAAFAIEEARTAAALAAMETGAEVFEYPPTYARKLVVGKGNATKQEVRSTMCRLFESMSDRWSTMTLDVSDAACIAVARWRDGGRRRPPKSRRHLTKKEVRTLLGHDPK